jgi:UDP-N-acetylmuramoyl-L-alanyl-D-glutamate--2,6-diaminopimelate ligase
MFKPNLKRSFQWLKNIFWHYPKALFYNLYYGFPAKKLILIGVTGTDGKTTTTILIHQCLTNAGIKAGLISTVGAKIGSKESTIGLHTTSPDPSKVQQLLRQMVDQGVTHAVIEVTAHALDQYRFHGCHFHTAVLTNTSHEHLDDFLNMADYINTKSKLFYLCDFAILNKDDLSYQQIKKTIQTPLTTYSINQKSDHQAKDITQKPGNLSFNVNDYSFKTNSAYHYQIYNILAAFCVLQSLKIDPQILINTIKQFPEIKGRREEVPNKYHFRTIVDFAHTPNALKNTLSSLRTTTTGKLIVIFGATGGRDQTKRPLMGYEVSLLADIAIITADDTRHEKVEDINQQIISGIDPDKKTFIYHNIPNRQDAFNLAVKLASPGDTIVACGKGHETTILHGKTEYPWSESDAFRTAFRLKK